MNQANLQCEKGDPAGGSGAHRFGGLSGYKHRDYGDCVGLNAIATSNSETVPRQNDLTHGSAPNFHYGIVHVSMPKGKMTFPPELLPLP